MARLQWCPTLLGHGSWPQETLIPWDAVLKQIPEQVAISSPGSSGSSDSLSGAGSSSLSMPPGKTVLGSYAGAAAAGHRGRHVLHVYTDKSVRCTVLIAGIAMKTLALGAEGSGDRAGTAWVIHDFTLTRRAEQSKAEATETKRSDCTGAGGNDELELVCT